MGVYTPHNQPETPVIFYGTMPHFRHRGYASAAINTFSDYVAQSHLATSVDAYVSPGNKESAHILQSQDFQQVDDQLALCESETGHRLPMRIFRKDATVKNAL